MLGEDELRDAVLLVFANKQVRGWLGGWGWLGLLGVVGCSGAGCVCSEPHAF
jgi:hypothetical protein